MFLLSGEISFYITLQNMDLILRFKNEQNMYGSSLYIKISLFYFQTKKQTKGEFFEEKHKRISHHSGKTFSPLNNKYFSKEC